MIIRTLPSNYCLVVRAILTSALFRKDPKTGSPMPITPSELLESIHAIARDDTTLGQKNESALIASDSKSVEKNTCANCGKKGHWKKDYWSKGGGIEGKGPG